MGFGSGIGFGCITQKRFEIGDKVANILLCGVPGTHETTASTTDESVKDPAAVPHPLDDRFGELGKNGVGLTREKDFDLRQRGEAVTEKLGHLVGVFGVVEPDIVLEHADPRGGKETHFRGELAGLLAAVFEFVREFEVEKDDRVPDVGAVFGTAEAKDVNPGLPGDKFGMDVQAGDSIGKASAIHVQFLFKFPAFAANGVEFFGFVNGADFGGLGDADSVGFGEMNVGALFDDAFDVVRLDFSLAGWKEEHFGTVGKKLRRAAFIGFDMGDIGAQEAVVGLTKRSESERIGRGAV